MVNVRNFWMRAVVDNKMHPVATGPKKPDGGMDITLSIRDKGLDRVALKIRCSAYEDGTLGITVHDHKGDLIHTHATTR